METLEEANDWNELAAQQRATRETEEMAQNQQMFDQFGAIEQNAKQQAMLRDRQRAIAGAAMMESAYRNGGMSDRSLGPAFSEAFGQPILGGQIVDLGEGRGRGFVLYGAGKDAQGNPSVAPVAMMDGAQMMRVLQRAGLGDRTAGLQKELYGEMSSRLTADQIGKMGIQNPSAPISTGGAVISAAGMRALRGEPRPRSTVSVFSNIGGDGYAGTGTRSATIRPDGTREEVATGTRREDAPGRWRVLSVGPDPSDEKGKRQIRRYENDKTGEVVDVPDGSSLRDVLRSGGSERERIAQMNNDSREKRAQVTAEATKYKADMAKEIAEIRARQQTGKVGREATANDAKRLAEIVGDYRLDEATRNAAKEALDNTLASLGKATSAPAQKGGDKGGSGFKQLSPEEYNALSAEEKAKYRQAWKNWKATQAK